MNVVLYTTNCPNCIELENLLKRNNIEFAKNTDVKEMIKKNFVSAPMLVVDDNIMTFEDAKKWLNELSKGEPVNE